MDDYRKEITISITNEGEERTVITYKNEYRNLMQLLNNSFYLEGFGECGGMGRCVTCLVRINGLKGLSNVLERNEKVTLGKMGLADNEFRLSCQVLITDDLNNAMVDILAENY